MMRRSRIIFLALGLVLGVLVAATTATGTHSRSAGDQRGGGGGRPDAFVRWDLVQAVNGVAVPGGTDISTDATTHDTIALTGSGQFEPREQEAAGGGTFVHEQANGTLVAKGSYLVTGFVSWQPLKGGNFAATGLVDGIGNGPGSSKDENEPTSGIVTLDVRLVPDGTAPGKGIDAVLSIHCNLPQTIGGDFEGFTLALGSFDFTAVANADPMAHGITLFHRLS
jgi:hypothetical protein